MLETTIGELLNRAVRYYDDRVAVRDGERELTYRDLGAQVNRLANALLGLGLARGDRVALLMWNCLEYVVCDLGVAAAGLVKVPLSHLLSHADVLFRIQDSEAAAVICDEYFVPMVTEVADQCPSLKHKICIAGSQGGQASFTAFDVLVAQGSSRPPSARVGHEDLVGIMYTGGTTGRSKGVMHTHKSVIAVGYSEIVEMDIGWREVLLHVAPLPHAAQFMLLPGLLRGGTHVIMRKFDPEKMLRVVDQAHVSWTFLVPTMISALLEHPALHGRALSSLRTILYGAAPMWPERLESAIERLGPIFLQAYGQMEVPNLVTTLTKDDHIEAVAKARGRLASCGRPIAMAQVRLVDQNDVDVSAGKPGEIIVRGPHMMRGYWRRPEETASTMPGGWIHTGDIARLDQDGYVYIVDRAKDMIISAGMNVYSVEVENALMEHPGVREACVIGRPDDKWGEAVSAFVVLGEGVSLEADELIQFCRQRLAAYSRPKAIEFVDEIPKTPYGKMDKKALRQRYWKSQERQGHDARG